MEARIALIHVAGTPMGRLLIASMGLTLTMIPRLTDRQAEDRIARIAVAVQIIDGADGRA